MTTSAYSVRLTDVLPLPSQFDGLESSLDSILDKIGLTNVSIVVNPPSLPPGSAGEPPISEDDAMALLEYYDDETEEVPPTPTIPQNVIPTTTLDLGNRVLTLDLKALSDIVLVLPGLDGVSLVLNPGGFRATLMLDVEHFSLGFTVGMGIRFSSTLLRPLHKITEDDGRVNFEPDTSRSYVQLDVASLSVAIDETDTISVSGGLGVHLSDPVMIGDTGMVIESADIVLNLSGGDPRPTGTPAGWKGLLINNASLRFPNLFSGPITATGLGIGSGGVSGTIGVGPLPLSYSPTSDPHFTGDLVGEVFGIEGGLREISLSFQQNIPSGGSIHAQCVMPFFEMDVPLDLDISLTTNGTFTVALHSSNGLLHLTKPDILNLTLESLGFEIAQGVFTIKLSGQITPLFGGLDWPSFKVKELAIDSHGNVHLDGGWLNLPDQYSLDFHGFQLEVTKLGFGKTDDGGKWIGFSGGLKLVDGLSAGASVEGLRVIWYDDGRSTRVTLNGVGVEFEVPDVLRFKGAVAYRELPGDVHRFDGAIKLELIALDLEIDATLVVGSAPGYTFFAIYLDAELPAGIPLWSTGVALYGMAGLFALNFEPDKHPDEEWYGIGASDGWYHRPPPPPGVTDLVHKWTNRSGSLALGGGVTIGTVYDNGFTFSGKVLLVIVFPGPILLIEGKADILKERAKLDEEAIFRALAVLDGRAGTFLIGLDAQYKYGDGGELIDIHGGVEAFFSFSDASAWHLYLGLKDPREKRIRAEILTLFEANSYFMLDAHQLAMGAWVGYDKRWSFGPLSVTVEAWIEGNALVSWKPVHLHGDLWLHGKAKLSVFGFGLGLSVDARFAADVFDPFHVKAEFSVGIDLPWPLPDFNVDITLEWGPTPNTPPLPLPLKEIAIEHFKVTTSWPLPRDGGQPLLLPNYDRGDGFLQLPQPTLDPNAAPPSQEQLPVVPLDCRPHVTFGRAVHDDALVGINAQPVVPEWERIGDPAKNEGPVQVRYGLKEVALDKYVGGSWVSVARKGTTPNAVGLPTLYGSWAPVPAAPDGNGQNVGQVKLWLWSKTPFDYTRHNGRAWDEWFTQHFQNYPCVPPASDRTICCDFEQIDPGETVRSPWRCFKHGERLGIILEWGAPAVQTVTKLDQPIEGLRHALCFPSIVSGAFTHVIRNQVIIAFTEPVKAVKIVVAGAEVGETRKCIDFRQMQPARGANPRIEQDVTFEVLDPTGSRQPATQIAITNTTSGPMSGLNCGFQTKITLPNTSSQVELTLTHFSLPGTIEAFNNDGSSADKVQMQHQKGDPETVRLSGKAIQQVIVHAPEDELLLHEICYTGSTATSSQVEAAGFGQSGNVYGPVFATNDVIEIEGENITFARVDSTGTGQICLVQVCANFGPDPAEVAQREEMAQHLINEMARWSQVGDVLEPHTTYRLTVVTTVETQDNPIGNYDQTEFAYFRTKGPPGLTILSVPRGSSNTNNFNSGLNDLVPYVHQTVPATIPAAGEKPPLPRPVYRAYDVGVEFNEDYVDLMYRLERRDLGLYLYDNNNQPVRDAQGRLIVLSNRWGKTEDVSLSESDKRWIKIINASNCATLDTTVIPHDVTLTSAAEGQVLNPDTVYEARLVPLLLHEDFANLAVGTSADGPSGTLDRWSVYDEGPNNGPSHWEIRQEGTPPSRYVIQTANIWGGTLDGNDPVKPGTLLLYTDIPALAANDPAQPTNWTDYRMSVYLCSADDDGIGIVFRYSDSDHYYRFSMDRQRTYRRLVRVVDGIHTILAEDDFVYQENQDYLITVEAIGPSLRVYQDGTLAFDVNDSSMDQGSIGLYCWGDVGAQFSDVRVDDFRKEAPAVYRFKFTTSEFTDFFAHLHSFQDETWRVVLPASASLASRVAQAVPLSTALSDDETRAYEALATQVLGQAAQQNPHEMQVTRVERGGEALVLLIQGPEPIDWKRTELDVKYADHRVPQPELPDTVKLTDVGFGASQPNEEWVTLLLRQGGDLTGTRIEQRQLPGPVAVSTDYPLLFMDAFVDEESGLLFREEFGPNALDHYTIVDEGTNFAPSNWRVAGGEIVQSSSIYGGSIGLAVPDKPGTLALTGSASWMNVRVSTTLYSNANGDIGITFRYTDQDNYYRFSMGYQIRHFRRFGYHRLIKKVHGQVQVLWENTLPYTLLQPHHLVIEAYGDRLLGYVDDALLFSVQDPDIPAGRIGLYCWKNPGAHFETLEVTTLEVPPVLWQPSFANLSEVQTVDETGAIEGPSQWNAQNGQLAQSSNIHVVDNSPHKPGTYAFGGSLDWRDVQVSVRLRSNAPGDMGVMFRYQDKDNYYRFSMGLELLPSPASGYRRLIKKVGGVVTVLWQDSAPYREGQSYELSLRAVGSELQGFIDGVPLFTVYDRDLKQGQVGFYCWANTGVHFERVAVTDRTQRVGRWTVHDEGTVGAPSVWQLSRGMLVQKASIDGGAGPTYPGTYAVAGESIWSDYRLRVDMRPDDNHAIGIIYRYVDDDNYYRLSLDAQSSYRRLIKKVNGVVTTLWEDTNSYTVGDDFTLTVDGIGPRLVGYMDNARLFEVNDTAHAAGQVGLYCWANTQARFERVEVLRSPLEAYALLRDRFARGDTSDWSFVDEGTLSGPSNWTTFEGALRQTSNIYEPPIDRDTLSKRGTQALAGDLTWTDTIISARLQSFDDDAIGLLFRYSDANHYYRFSMDSQRNYQRLVKNVGGTFSLLWENAAAYEVGRSYELTVVAAGSTLRGYLDDVPMFVVDDVDLPAGRIGLYCWGDQDARFSQVRVYPIDLAFNTWLLNELFNVLVQNRWNFVNDGDQEGPSQWEVTGGELRQTSNIHGGSTDPGIPDKPGTYALTGDKNWADYCTSVRLCSDTTSAIGVMFRCQDKDNYYRFSMDHQGSYRRLIKKVAGAVTVLWEDSIQYTVGREYIVTIDCVGERLTGYLDGIQLFAVDDSSLAAGCIGLYCWANNGARFKEVRMAAPAWTPYYAFGHEERLPDGKRVRVYAGNPNDAPPEEPGVVRRFVASLDERGSLQLPSEGVTLRVRTPNKTGGHMRHFLPDGDYNPVDARVLRKADGTAFFLVVPAATPDGSQLIAGQYRLKMTYRRDNRAVDPASQVFSKAGNSAPEQVTIDIPW